MVKGSISDILVEPDHILTSNCFYMNKTVTYPAYMINQFKDDKGNFTMKFQAILFLMRVTGIPHLNNLTDVFNMVLRIKMATTIIKENLDRDVSRGTNLIVLNMNDECIGISIQDLIDHVGFEIENTEYQSINYYSKSPVANWGAVIISGNKGLWSDLYPEKTYIDDEGVRLALPPFVLLASGLEFYRMCRQWTIRQLALY